MFIRATIRLVSLAAITIVLGFAAPSVRAQSGDDASCPALVEQALFDLGSNCDVLGRNTACYGYNRVDATFAQSFADDFFSQPSDRTELATLKTIQTAPLDLALEQWGIAVMNVQANVPDTLPGQAVTFLLMGDVEVENAVAESISTASGPATAITQQDADLRAEPNADSALIGPIAAGTVLQIDARREDGEWLRVTSSIGVGWINAEAVNQTTAIASLPIEGQANQSPMQAFYFRNGPAETTCQETPSVLAIQSPENITVDLTANGANIRLGSLVMLRVLPGGDEMQLTTLEGMAILDADTPDAIHVPAGFSTTRCLTEADNLGSDDQSNDQEVGDECAWEEPNLASDDQLLQGEIVRGAIIQLNLEGGEILPEVTPTSPSGDECPAGTNITHLVSAGENLFRIGLRYRTGMGAIMQANGLTNPQLIYTGQQLVIPCGVDTGLPSIPQPLVIPTIDQTSITPVDCSRFRATSPLDGLSYPVTTFYWDAVPGATGYRVNLFNVDERNGALVGSFLAQGLSTNLTADVSIESVGYGFSFAWEVQALYNGQVACTSQRFNVPRQSKPVPPSGPGGLTVSWSCISGVLTVTYANVPVGDTSVTISFLDSMAGPSGRTLSVPPNSGSAVFTPVFTVSAGVVRASPSGASGTLTPAVMAC